MSSAESRPKPDHKIQLSHAAGVVPRPALNPEEGRIRQLHRRRSPLLVAEKREHGTNTHLGER
jgi:hypothetical protein